MTTFVTTSARLQHAYNQYESLLIRAGDIIDHVPNSLDNSFDNSDLGHDFYKSNEKKSNVPDLSHLQRNSNMSTLHALPVYDSSASSLLNHFNTVPILPSPGHISQRQHVPNANTRTSANNNEKPAQGDIADDEKVDIILTLEVFLVVIILKIVFYACFL